MVSSSTSAAALVGTPTSQATQAFTGWDANAVDGCARAALLGCPSAVVLRYPRGVRDGTVRTAHTTCVEALRDVYLADPAGVSSYAKSRVHKINDKYKKKKAEGLATAREWRSKSLSKLALSLAKTTALHALLRQIFGIHRSPHLKAPAAGGGEEEGVPTFLCGDLRAAWPKPWGGSCLQTNALDASEMIKILEQVMRDCEDGCCLSESACFARAFPSLFCHSTTHLALFLSFSAVYSVKKAKDWSAVVKERKLTLSTTPYDPEDPRVYMARCRQIVIPKGLVELVCTEAQRASSKATGGVFVVRVLLVSVLPKPSPYAAILHHSLAAPFCADAGRGGKADLAG